MNSEKYKDLKGRVINILTSKPWIWNDFSKVLSLVWLYDVKELGLDPKLLTSEGLMRGMWQSEVTDAELIYRIFKELQLINGNQKSNTLNMENTAEVIPHRVPVLAHLKLGKTLTGLQAWNKYGCYRLAPVISRLNKNPAINIICTIVSGERYGEYKLIKS